MLRGFKGTVPTVAPTAYIDASAQIVGDVSIGEESSVWMNAVVRGEVNHFRIVGHGSIVAAETLLPEGCVVPPRSLVMGSPGRVRRAITDAEYALIRQSAENYVQYRLDYL